MDVVRIIGLELDCIVGIRAFERHREQRVRLDLELGVDTRKAGRSGKISHTVDYDMVAHHLMAMLRFRRYQLIEMAAEELSAMLLSTEPELQHVRLRIDKPGALEGRAQAACVEIMRTLRDFDPTERRTLFGIEREVLRTRDARLLTSDVEPGRSWSFEHDARTRCMCWPVLGALHAETRSLEAGQVDECEHSGHVRWENRGAEAARIFQCVVPAPEDAVQ